MLFGVHLPQTGRAAGPEGVRRVAEDAEELGFDDVWVSDHLAVPAGAQYPPSFLYEPIVALTWAAAATGRVGLGTSVLVLPYRHPVHLAKELSSLDQLSGGRLIVGAAAGWLEEEFKTLNVPFHQRGSRADESISAIRACWEQDPVSFEGATVRIESMRVLPRPDRKIPIWVGGLSPAALRRAVRLGDGWHGTSVKPEDVAPLTRRLREDRPEPSFTLSVRTRWDGLRTDHDEIRRDIDAYRQAGVQHLMAAPAQGELDGWRRSLESLGELFAKAR
jgi:probable F420-dependent oxidoreductase